MYGKRSCETFVENAHLADDTRMFEKSRLKIRLARINANTAVGLSEFSSRIQRKKKISTRPENEKRCSMRTNRNKQARVTRTDT